MASKNLQGTVEYYIRGQYGLIKGENGKEYCFGRKAVGDRSKLVNGDVVNFTVDQNHPILVSKVTSYVAVKSRLIKSLAKKGYGFQIEKDGKWNILVRYGDKKLVLEDYSHMTIMETTEWVKRAKKLTKEEIKKMFTENNVKDEDHKIGGHVVPDEMAKYFGGVEDDDTDTPVKKSLEEAVAEEDAEKNTGRVRMLA
ncbi:hypothetical protein [Blautia glucerasea]|uniref:hypothetical protein n=1 Tax=Blautia glucerasea TaxID=536633 RepID=UPI00156F4838|nr:hypothetical protein [Blautia glucerasea]NSL04425.1 hypothetical protein [Blautia glucerasea]